MIRWPIWPVDLLAPAARGRLWIRVETIALGVLGGAMGAAFVLVALTALKSATTLAWFDAHPGAAGWFQAFGAIAALLVAVGLPMFSAEQARKRLRITAFQLGAEAVDEVGGYLERISVRQPAWTASEDPDESLARVATALGSFPATELAVLGGLRSFIGIGVLVRRAQEMLPQIAMAKSTGRRGKSGYGIADAEHLLEDLGIMLEELRKDLQLPRVAQHLSQLRGK
jgi:hypothetical protein